MSAKIQRALISVSDKTGIIDFAGALSGLGIEIISTGGTARSLQENGVRVTTIDQVTDFPEMMDGRIKTLHPKIHGALLGIRDNAQHASQADSAGIRWIDLVAVNLYPFESTILKPGVSIEEAIENIDIGGPAMLRSAAKNHRFVTVITDPADYEPVLNEIRAGGAVSAETRQRLAPALRRKQPSESVLLQGRRLRRIVRRLGRNSERQGDVVQQLCGCGCGARGG
jgi:phosphoribosylaminoimidazolecarboxamide formyltransferase/IMP cyclohydrolase